MGIELTDTEAREIKTIVEQQDLDPQKVGRLRSQELSVPQHHHD